MLRRLLLGFGFGALALTLTWGSLGSGARTEEQSSFAAEVAALSEPAGYFDTDNLISNERSYLEVIPDLKKRGVRGGVYIGVGPDQNFSYIAAIRPDVAYIVDVRRDNLLLHLLFKAIFTLARTRVEYLAMLFGRPVPDNIDAWRTAPLDRIVAHIEGAALDERSVAALRERLDDVIAKTGVPLTRPELATIDRFHRRFIEAGVGLRFQSTGRPPQSHYPTYRDLLLATDSLGERSNYLASEEALPVRQEPRAEGSRHPGRRRSEWVASALSDRDRTCGSAASDCRRSMPPMSSSTSLAMDGSNASSPT